MTVTLKFQSSGVVPGDGRPVVMQGGSLTVGRGPANDLVLPDPDRMLSKNHFVIEDHNGNVVIMDLSTNGTFLNYSKVPLGRTPTPINNGDVLSVGSYEMVVEIGKDVPGIDDLIAPPTAQDAVSHGQAQNAPDPLALMEDAGPGGDFLDDLLGGDAPKGPGEIKTPDPFDELLPPLGEEEDPFFKKPDDGREGTGASVPEHTPSVQDSFQAPGATGGNLIPDDWDDLLEPSGNDAPTPPPGQPPAPIPAEQESPAPVPPERKRTPPMVDPQGSAEVPGGDQQAPALMTGDQSAAQAFLKSLDVEDLRIDDADLQTTMARMGRVLRTMITGLREILMTRTSIKSEFRIDQTMIGAGGNNPLKFSISPEQAIDDIKAHEVAMVTGMEAALKGVLGKLDPEVLAGKIETSGALGSLLKGKKARYWEVYEKMYAEISDQAENDFHELFSREFARAYKEQLEKLK